MNKIVFAWANDSEDALEALKEDACWNTQASALKVKEDDEEAYEECKLFKITVTVEECPN